MRNRNRILRVELIHKIDESPDTSHMGEYSNKRTSEFSIDRAHSEDCASQTYNGERPDLSHDHSCSYREGGECDCEKDTRCDCGGFKPRHELQYFNPSFNYVNSNGFPVAELTPEEVREYVSQDYARMERLNAGDWNYMGVIAQAHVATPDTFGYTEQVIHSGGLWGIETDSDKAYIKEEEDRQLHELREILMEFGFSTRQISAAFKQISR